MIELYLGDSERILWQTPVQHNHQSTTTSSTSSSTSTNSVSDDHNNIANSNLMERLCKFQQIPLKARCLVFSRDNLNHCNGQFTVKIEALAANPTCTFSPAHFNSLTWGLMIGLGAFAYLVLICVLPAYFAYRRHRQNQLNSESQFLIANRDSAIIQL